jgi:hypothetical protein
MDTGAQESGRTAMQSLDTFSQAWNEALVKAKPLSDRLSFKGYKHYPAMSEETTAFSATLTHDGEAVATVRNDGRGGCTEVSWRNPEVARRIEGDFLALTDTTPERTVLNFEGYISQLAADHREDKAWMAFVKRWAPKGWRCFRVKKGGALSFLRINDGRKDGDDRSRKRIESEGYTIIDIF